MNDSVVIEISTPEVTHHETTWTPRKGVLPRPDVPSRPASSDVYKSRLLAYATTMADQMITISSGDESLPRQQTDKRVDLLEIERAASSPVTQNPSPLGLIDKRIPNTLSEDPTASGYDNGHATTPELYTETLDPNDWTQLGLVGPLAEARLDRSTTALTAFSEFGAPNNNRSGGELAPTNLSGNFNTTGTYVEGVEQDIINEFEEDEPLVSDYYVIQEDYDMLAADEPSDDESWLTGQHQATTLRQGSEDGHPVPEVDYGASTIFETPKRGPKIQPFPMKVSRLDPVRDATAPDENQPMLSRLAPKFIPQSSRHVRPSPFAALLKKQLKDHPDAVGAKGQHDAAEDHEDEIEPWLG
ncbi:unnamed protein product [Rhizoctonia solani]|uniref:Uncharacterized protein n=1 Tax=Rhizoctonia solani TaxID=456999 RepID=A0A8H3BPA9_9AGAM|nr:unnamed protein product [Rhizoctonia solani]